MKTTKNKTNSILGVILQVCSSSSGLFIQKLPKKDTPRGSIPGVVLQGCFSSSGFLIWKPPNKETPWGGGCLPPRGGGFLPPPGGGGILFDQFRVILCLFVCWSKTQKLYSASCVWRGVNPLGVSTHGQRHSPRAYQSTYHVLVNLWLTLYKLINLADSPAKLTKGGDGR